MKKSKLYNVRSSRSILSTPDDSNLFFDVVSHDVRLSAGNNESVEFLTIEYKFFASSIACLDDSNRILLLKMPRFAIRNNPGDEYIWEMPGGRNVEFESPEDCAKRELLEETGISTFECLPILKDYFYPECSFGTEKLFLFYTRHFKKIQSPIPETAGIYEHRWFHVDEAIEMIYNGHVRSSWTIIGLLGVKHLLNL